MRTSKFNLKIFAQQALRIIPWILLAWVGYQRLAAYSKESEFKNTIVPITQIPVAHNGTWEAQDLNSPGQKKVLIFWTTWCVPCQVELHRLESLVEEGSLDPKRVLAISSFEDQALVTKTLRQRGYKFPVGLDQDGYFARAFHISSTPTTAFLEGTRLQNESMGFTLNLESSINGFLNERN